MNNNFTLIFVTYNSQNIIREALDDFINKKIKIIIVDNASNDDTVNIIEKISESSVADIKLIKSDKNLGFSRANNAAIRLVTTEFALLLNPDCKIKYSDIDILIKKSKQFKNIAITSGVITDKDGREDPISKVRNPDQDLLAANIQDVKFISGCCMLLKLQAFENIDLFDEGFFLYCEDNELCKRVIKNGFKLAICPEVKLYHQGGQSSEKSDKINLSILSHRLGWSKCYYTQKIHFKIIGKLRAVRDIFRSIFKMATIKKSDPRYHVSKARLKGCFYYLIGRKAFDKNGNPNLF